MHQSHTPSAESRKRCVTCHSDTSLRYVQIHDSCEHHFAHAVRPFALRADGAGQHRGFRAASRRWAGGSLLEPGRVQVDGRRREYQGRLRPRRETPAGWRLEVDRDMQAGLYFDTQTVRPALIIFAMDTDRDRVRQFDRNTRQDLKPLVKATERHRREEIRRFRKNGTSVDIVEIRHAAHYCFVQRPDEISRLITAFVNKGR